MLTLVELSGVSRADYSVPRRPRHKRLLASAEVAFGKGDKLAVEQDVPELSAKDGQLVIAWTIHETPDSFISRFFCSGFWEGAEYGMYPFCPANAQKYYAEAGAKALEWNLRLRNQPSSIPPPELLNKYYEVLALVASHGSVGLGAVAAGLETKLKYIEDTLKKLEKLYIDTFSRHGNLGGPEFFQKRRIIYAELDVGVNRLILATKTGAYSSHSMKKTLGVSSKSIVHQWKNFGASPGSVPGLSP